MIGFMDRSVAHRVLFVLIDAMRDGFCKPVRALILKRAVDMCCRPTVRAELSRSMKGLQHFHRLGEASNYHSPFDGLRANGSLRLSTALFRLILDGTATAIFIVPTLRVGIPAATHQCCETRLSKLGELQCCRYIKDPSRTGFATPS